MYPTVECTARDTPQHNHLAEVFTATIYGHTTAMMVDTNVPDDTKHIVAQKAIEMATKLDGLVPITINGQTKARVEHFGVALSYHLPNTFAIGVEQELLKPKQKQLQS